MADKVENNERVIPEIPQGEADTLNTRDMVESPQNPVKRYKEMVTEAGGNLDKNTEPQKNDIPKLDLANQIMAQQRRISAAKRTRSGGKVEAEKPVAKAEALRHLTAQSKPRLSKSDDVIKEIVARDIKRLQRGELLEYKTPSFYGTTHFE